MRGPNRLLDLTGLLDLVGSGGGVSYSDEVLADLPDAYWKMDDESGTTFADSSGNEHSLTTSIGAPELMQDPLILSGYSFRLSGDQLVVPDAAWLDTTFKSFTLEAWVLLEGAAGYYEIFDRYSGAAGSFFFRIDTEGGAGRRLIFFVEGTGTIQTYSFLNGVAYHVAVTHQAGGGAAGVKLYINGEQVKTGAAAALVDDMAYRLGVGTGTGGNFLGRLDEVAVYPTVLTTERIAAHYAAGIA